MSKLNQILAIEKGVKTNLHKEISELHHALQKSPLLNGHHKVFTPKEEEGETFPDDVQKIQYLNQEVIDQVCERMSVLMDVTAAKDWSNCAAKADVLLDGNVFLEQVPVTYLLFLEKELNDLHKFVNEIVELDPGEQWTFDANTGQYHSEPIRTSKTKKLQKPIVLYPATEQHPAQTQLITEDIVIGHWTTTKFSGAIPRQRKKALLDRITKLTNGVKFAREQANSIEAVEPKIGKKILGFLFED